MITPAVLISASGMLVLSTSSRLARIVDRVRELSRSIEELFSGGKVDYAEERRREVEVQLGFYARRSRLVQRSLTSFYLSLAMFVGSTVAIGFSVVAPGAIATATGLGMTGSLSLLYGTVLLIGETRLALKSVNEEMEFRLKLAALYQARQSQADAAGVEQIAERFHEQVGGKRR